MAKAKGGTRAAAIQLRPSGRPVRMTPLNVARNIEATGWFQSPVNPGMVVNAKGNRVAQVKTEEMALSGKRRFWVQLYENGVAQGAAQIVSNLANGKRMGEIWVSRGE